MNIQRFLLEQLKGFDWPEDLTVLACGGRDFADVPAVQRYADLPAEVLALVKRKEAEYAFVWDVLSDLYCLWLSLSPPKPEGRMFTLAEGEDRGADRASKEFVETCILEDGPRYMQVKPYPADWKRHGKSAGPIRNQLMLYETQPHIVVAFPGGRGTADMVRKAKHRGGKVIEVPYPIV